MRRNSIFLIALYLAIQCVPQYVEAQSFPVPAGYREEGNASWYGEEFSGRPTASGELFNPTLFTAAHPTLPFGTFLIVTNKNNNRQVTVKVNDRGPFVASRILDLSKAAAEHLDMINAGTAPVIIETLSSSYAQPPEPPPVYSMPAPTPQASIPPVPPPAPPPQALPQAPIPQALPQASIPQALPQAPLQASPPAPPPAAPPAPPLAAQQAPIPPSTIAPPAPEPVRPPEPVVYAPPTVTQAPQESTPYPPITINVYPSPQEQPQSPVPPQAQPQLYSQVQPQTQQQLYPQVPPLEQSQFYQQVPPQTQFNQQIQPYSLPFQLPNPYPAVTALPPPQIQPPVEYTPPPNRGIKLIPDTKPLPGNLYKIQVGSYKVPRYAVEAFDKLKGVGLNPSYEQNEEFYRVVLTRIPGIEVQSVADKLARAGFREALIREER